MRIQTYLQMKRAAYFTAKRAFDILTALVGIAITLPFWAVAAIGIELSDRGPLFYKAVRIGRHNAEFHMWKFRSMRVAKTREEASEQGFKADEARIFPFGALLRRLKIDELPQLLNILLGHMSLVGPRPVSVDQAEHFRAEGTTAHTVRPGLTGPAALYDYLYGDTITDEEDYRRLVLPTRQALEEYYPAHMSLLFDLKMIFYTAVCIMASVFGKRADGILATLRQYVAPKSGAAEENNKEIAHK